jgi:hypothetical protein
MDNYTEVIRIQLKPTPKDGITYDDVMEFCKKEEIIGVGWASLTTREDDYWTIREELQRYYKPKSATTGLKSINALRCLKEGDLIWTRLGGDGSQYYLCRVGKTLWKDSIATQAHVDHDICQFVSVKWLYIGKEDKVPGKVINSFIPALPAQRVKGVAEVSKYIWDINCPDESLKYNNYGNLDFWSCINSEDLECLILMYLQFKGYYIVSSSFKHNTPKIEAPMISHDGKTRCYQQIKREVKLPVEDYIPWVKENEVMYLFTTSENYGSAHSDRIKCISKNEVETFIREHPELLPSAVTNWISLTQKK